MIKLLVLFGLTFNLYAMRDMNVTCHVIVPCMTNKVQVGPTTYKKFGINHYYKRYNMKLKAYNGYKGGFTDETDLYRISVMAEPREKSSFLITLFDKHSSLVIQDVSKIEVLRIAPVNVGLYIPRGNQPNYLFKLSFLDNTPADSGDVEYNQSIINGLEESIGELPEQFETKREGIRVSCSLPSQSSAG